MYSCSELLESSVRQLTSPLSLLSLSRRCYAPGASLTSHLVVLFSAYIGRLPVVFWFMIATTATIAWCAGAKTF